MAAPYLIELPYATVLPEKANVVVVYAEDEDTALDACKARFGGDSDALWDEATVTEIAETADGLEGFRLHVAIVDPSDQSIVFEATITAADGDDVDDMGGDIATALEAEGGTDLTPSYDSGTNILTIAAAGDALGDMAVIAEVLFPITWKGPEQVLTGAVTTIVDEGASGAALTCVLVDQVVPTILSVCNKIG